MTENQPLRPANMNTIVAINQGKRPCSMRNPEPPLLEPAEVQRRAAEGHVLLDARSAQKFGRGHIPNAYSVLQDARTFEQAAGWILPADRPIVLVEESKERARQAAHKLAFIGLDCRVDGYIDMATWEGAGLPTAAVPQIDVLTLGKQLEGLRILDVRDAEEWSAGHIDSAVYMNYKQMPGNIDKLPLTPDERIAVVCAGGMRSSAACSMLRQAGYEDVRNVTGGMTAWARAGLPIV